MTIPFHPLPIPSPRTGRGANYPPSPRGILFYGQDDLHAGEKVTPLQQWPHVRCWRRSKYIVHYYAVLRGQSEQFLTVRKLSFISQISGNIKAKNLSYSIIFLPWVPTCWKQELVLDSSRGFLLLLARTKNSHIQLYSTLHKVEEGEGHVMRNSMWCPALVLWQWQQLAQCGGMCFYGTK